MLNKILPMALLAVLLTGCNATFTNLTPKQQVRNAEGLYPVEVSMNTRQGTLRWDSIQPKIMIGTNAYPMRSTLLMSNRWEGLVPVAPGTNIVYYKYRLDFLYNDFGGPKPDSRLSEQYRLLILDE
ncbi:MAG: hypothetical protein MUE94_09505 [Verrucomicrobia bacterium]|jgi:hypothetical protein|nr:hypothetical protein [Verrucomicrobiota bacterium]